MPKCPDCRTKEAELTTWWERLKNRAFHLFGEEIIDLSQDKYTQGFGDGYKKGSDHAKEHFDEALKSLQEPKVAMPTDWFVDLNQVLSIQNGGLYMGAEKLTPQQIKNLKAECKTLENFIVWKMIQETLRQKAIEKAVLASDGTVLTNVNPELLAGKMMIHTLGIIKSIKDVIEKHA